MRGEKNKLRITIEHCTGEDMYDMPECPVERPLGPLMGMMHVMNVKKIDGAETNYDEAEEEDMTSKVKEELKKKAKKK